MSRAMSGNSQYNTSLGYNESKCLVTFLVKQGNWAGHAMIALEGKGIADNGQQDLIVFDFMQKTKAAQLAENEEKNRDAILKLLTKLSQDEKLGKLADTAHKELSSKSVLYQITSAAFKIIVNENKDFADFLGGALVTSSATVSGSVLSLFTQDVGIVRSSHPLDSKNPMQKIREWESTAAMKDIHYTLQISRDELNKLIAKIRSEESTPRPFQFLGSQQSIWKGSNCLDWILEKLKTLPSCTELVKTAWENSGIIVATPYSFCKALEGAAATTKTQFTSDPY